MAAECRLVVVMDGFFKRNEQLEIYNRAFHTLSDVRDDGLRKRMSVTFGALRAVNREWVKLIREAGKLKQAR